MPNERDESSDSQAAPDPSHVDVREQAFDDARKGQPDTDKGPVLDQIYNERVGRNPGPPRR